MRIRSQKQLYFKPQSPTLEYSSELSATSALLESLPEYGDILSRVQRDLNPNSSASPLGRKGMTAEQVLLSLLLRTRKNYSYRELSEATKDSISAREFLKIAPYESGFNFKTLQSNIKLISEDTLNVLDEALKSYGKSKGIEDGKKTRTDATAIETNIHYPSDAAQLNDSIRVLSRILTMSYEELFVPLTFTNHYRASKKKLFRINNTRSPKTKRKLNMELIRLCRNTIGYAKEALPVMESHSCSSKAEVVKLMGFITELKHFMPLVEQVIDVAYRRIVLDEKVPANEKIVSIFEEHTDIIVKGQRDVVFGHKATITTGSSGLILDLQVHDGNPSDASVVRDVLSRHKESYKDAPESMVFDGCYSSEENRELLLGEGVKNLTFSKESDEQATCSRVVRKTLRYFRAGIEATVSMLKRMFGWTRVMDKGRKSFNKALKAGTIAYNLFVLAKISIQSSA